MIYQYKYNIIYGFALHFFTQYIQYIYIYIYSILSLNGVRKISNLRLGIWHQNCKLSPVRGGCNFDLKGTRRSVNEMLDS